MRIKTAAKRKFIRNKIPTFPKFNKTFSKVSIIIPKKWSLLILKSLKQPLYTFHLFSTKYSFKFSLSLTKSALNYCFNTGVITASSYFLSGLILQWAKKVNSTLYLFSSFIFNKLKFKGKGYYIYKNIRNTIAPQFGYYHRIYIYSYFNKVRFLSKTKVLLFGLTKEDVLHSSYGIKKKRPVNIFTGRGVRFAHQIIYKKTGKVSSYR
jgi:hypothetical protein